MMSAEAAFGPLRAALEGAGIRYAVGGSWASTAYGEPRFTDDVDIVADIQCALNADSGKIPKRRVPSPRYPRSSESRRAGTITVISRC